MPHINKNSKSFFSLCFVTMFFVLVAVTLPAYAIVDMGKLLASDGAADDYFGNSVSMSGDVAIIGASRDDDNGLNSGSAYIYRYDGVNWNEEQKLLASDGAANDWFGHSVSMSGDVAIISAHGDDDNGAGAAYIFRYDGANWNEEQKLLSSDGVTSDIFGYSVSLSGNAAIISAHGDDDNGGWAGSAYIFRYDGATWNQEQKLLASDGAAGDRFGISVSISGDAAIVGAYFDNDNGLLSGSSYIFRYNGASWIQEQKLLASDGAADDFFGEFTSISGDTAIIGVSNDDDNGSFSGSSYIFRYNGTSWIQEQKLLASDGVADDYFGISVSISGDMAIVGARWTDDNVSNSGSAYVFVYDGLNWIEEHKIFASDGAADDRFGDAVSISGNRAIIGARFDDDSGFSSGSAYVFGDLLPGGSPIPDVKANGSDGPVVIPVGTLLTVTAALDPGSMEGVNADFWVWADSPFRTYWFTLASGWVPSVTPVRVYGGALFALAPYTIYSDTTLPIGSFTINFAVDSNMDGNFDATYSDAVGVTVE